MFCQNRTFPRTLEYTRCTPWCPWLFINLKNTDIICECSQGRNRCNKAGLQIRAEDGVLDGNGNLAGHGTDPTGNVGDISALNKAVIKLAYQSSVSDVIIFCYHYTTRKQENSPTENSTYYP